MAGEKIIFRVHAIQRMFQRHIDELDVHAILETGEVIEEYHDDAPYPSQLLLGWAGARPVHVVVAHNRKEHEIIVITAYVPDPGLWDPGFRRRRP